jgi:hypothetical protein
MTLPRVERCEAALLRVPPHYPWRNHGATPVQAPDQRLRVAAYYIKTGTVKFPRAGCEHLLTQLLGFRREKHDDAIDGEPCVGPPTVYQGPSAAKRGHGTRPPWRGGGGPAQLTGADAPSS